MTKYKVEELSDLVLTPINERDWKLLECWSLRVNDKYYTIPADYVTNMASIPRIFWNIYPPSSGRYRKPAVLHDWMCSNNIKNRDEIFRDYMLQEGCVLFNVYSFYYSVKLYHNIKNIFKYLIK